MAKRTVLRSSKGKKLYAVRGAGGRFKDIQTFKRAHAADLRLTSKAEKRERLSHYLRAFAASIIGGHISPRVFQGEWKALWARIDKLKVV